ncbi:hypothetical protein [Parageobacillus thermoglucosidasius]|uniref:Uncharacterized protein n=2 Tax=Anoxybacillaceae TaxID=3120669 RepID=A0AAN1D7F7_PARTM|nr:hypothetical protein [Parageobacillus thermoglucosidasius]REK53834.1 MAG: hypothetical protein C6P36_15855 [Geobacillus sp.]AEH47771.1 hypothetical protein Geoth_1805 [Parageobacillus thermoglucosidasius C56-YS93]ALF10988.1 hypothetical protein AOT13_13765 [Parageobacillus thermoglucosidasius]ANZ31065.1 hypothetical protein BCV53_13775 [Parageobacillus thermoglucosidasius]APM81802.1 hypothetical protein BCV54_13785 [Parageobacillus thermoglucosidasius]
MKLIGISLFIGSVLISITIGMDILIGLTLPQSAQNVLNPFRAMETPEMFILFLFLLIWAVHLLASLLKQKKT